MKRMDGNILLVFVAAIVCFPVGVILALAKNYK